MPERSLVQFSKAAASVAAFGISSGALGPRNWQKMWMITSDILSVTTRRLLGLGNCMTDVYLKTLRVTTAVAVLMVLVLVIAIGASSIAFADDAMLPEVKQPAAPLSSAEAAAIANVEEPTGYRLEKYREPVPKTLTGAKVIVTADVEKLHAGGKSAFIDVYPRAPKPPNLPAGTLWRDPPHMTMPGAVWMPNVGYGILPAETETTFKTQLEKVSGGDKSKTMVFYCLRNCWMSWNAAKRAVSYGYSAVQWFPDGNDGWQEAGNELANVKPLE